MDEQALVGGLRSGENAAFRALVEQYGGLMTRLAVQYLHSRALAEEVVQETWIAVLESIDRFEGRSSLKTWLVQILLNQARSRHRREARSIPFSALSDDQASALEPLGRSPEEKVIAREQLGVAGAALRSLPQRQRDVLLLRDVAGWSPQTVTRALTLTDSNQRVLLHRARATVRAELAAY